MADTRYTRRERFGAAALAALLVLSVVAGATGLGAAHGETEHLSRDGGTVTVRLGDSHDVKQAKQIRVVVEGGPEVTVKEPSGNKTGTFQIPVRKLSAQDADLESANVTVKANGTALFTRQLDLRVLKFGENQTRAARFSGGELRIPLTQGLGYADGADVDVALDDNDAAASGTVRYEDDGAYLAVSFASEELDLPVQKRATIDVSDHGSAPVNLRAKVREATGVSRLDGETVVVTNPLFAGETSYDLVVESENPQGTFASEVSANENGELAVSNRLLAEGGNLTLSAYRDGDAVFEGATDEPATEPPATATVEPDGSVVNLTDATLSGERATVWLSDGSQYVSVSVPTSESSVDLSSTAYRLDPEGSYQLLVEDGDALVRVTVPGDDGASTLSYAPTTENESGSANESATGESSDGVVATLADNPFLVGGGAFLGVVFVVGLVVVGIRIGSSGPSGAGSAGAATGRGDTHPVEVRIFDAATGGRFDGDARVVARQKHQSANSLTEPVSNGRASLSLNSTGIWYVEVETETGVSMGEEKIRAGRDSELRFEIEPQDLSVEVRDDDGTALDGISVTYVADDGERDSTTTRSGRADFDVPLGASEAEVSADHEKFHGDETTVSFGDSKSGEASLTLQRKTGDLRLTATVDGTPVAGIPVEVHPRAEAVREWGDGPRETTTDESGVATFEGLLAGKYEVQMAVLGGGDAFSVQSKRVRVGDGGQTRETVDATFEYSLGRSHRDRIASLRREVESLASSGNRDVAIPRYYGSVVTDLLDTTERVSGQGHRFATANADPDAVVTALLDAAEEAVELIGDAMTTKRNIDLFGACADMADERVEWDEGFDADVLFELLTEDRTAQRETVFQQLRTADDRIDDERSDLAVVAPARELWEDVQEFVNEERGDDPVRRAAFAFVARGLLDAVDELFDHEELRNRLERTVF